MIFVLSILRKFHVTKLIKLTIEEIIQQAEKQLQNREITKALENFKKVFEVLPKDAHIASQIGVCYFHLKDNTKALEYMNFAVQLEPEYSYRYSSRAYILAANNQIDDAIRDYNKCIEMDPEDSIAHNNLGLLLEQKGWQKQANESFTKADTLEGISPRLNNSDNNETIQSFEKENNKEIKDNTNKDEIIQEDQPSKKKVIKSIFTSKSTFKEFLAFIKNGFKLPEDE